MSDLTKPSRFRRDYQVIVKRTKRFWNFLWTSPRKPGSHFDIYMTKVEEAMLKEAATYKGNRTEDGKRLEMYVKTSDELRQASQVLVNQYMVANDFNRCFLIDDIRHTAIKAECLLDALSEQKYICQKAKDKVWINRTTRRPITEVTKNDLQELSFSVNRSKELKTQFDAIEKTLLELILSFELIDSENLDSDFEEETVSNTDLEC